MVTAMGVSGLYFCVRALKSLQNAIRFNRYWPRAGPTGGAGRAAPAGTVRRIVADTGRRVRISFSEDMLGGVSEAVCFSFCPSPTEWNVAFWVVQHLLLARIQGLKCRKISAIFRINIAYRPAPTRYDYR